MAKSQLTRGMDKIEKSKPRVKAPGPKPQPAAKKEPPAQNIWDHINKM